MARPGVRLFGLLNLNERLRLYGGRLELDTPAGGGTAVTLALPARAATPAYAATRCRADAVSDPAEINGPVEPKAAAGVDDHDRVNGDHERNDHGGADDGAAAPALSQPKNLQPAAALQ